MLKIPAKTEYVIDRLIENGYEAYIVGGCVRDMLLGNPPYDFDVTTSATPAEVMSLFPKTVPTGIKHGTVTVIIENENIEVTTFRTESGYSDSRHPENVNFITSLKEDLARRDFTVNAIAYNNTCGLKDYFGGIEDLKKRILRAVGEPEKRFAEDALRILRLFRFASTLNFYIEKKTLLSALKLAGGLKNISRERIAAELKKAACGENIDVLAPLISSGGLSFINITACPNFEAVKKCSANQSLAFFTFLYTAKCDILTVLDELKSSNKLKNYCATLLKLLEYPLPQSKAEIKKMLAILSGDIFEDYLTLRNVLFDDNISILKDFLNEIIKNDEPYLISHLNINGKELSELGIKDRKIGKTLVFLKEKVIENPSDNTKKKLIEYILKNNL